MVLFNELEATFLLDLYLHLRGNPQNLTSGGVLLKMHARDALTKAMNRCFPRDTPWTESQVTVKFKNLRSEYMELKWLTEQPGFQLDGKGLSDGWWNEIKLHRPKVHAFKGKLPWPYFKKMAVIVGDLPSNTDNLTTARNQQRVREVLGSLNHAFDPLPSMIVSPAKPPMAVGNSPSAASDLGHPIADAAQAVFTPSTSSSNPAASTTMAVAVTGTLTPGQRPSSLVTKRKRVADYSPYERERQQSLLKSVEQGSKAAADMAKGFNELVMVYRQQAAKCAQLESTGADDTDDAEERRALASLATALEHSAQATAQAAKGFQDLVTFFIQEADDVSSCTV